MNKNTVQTNNATRYMEDPRWQEHIEKGAYTHDQLLAKVAKEIPMERPTPPPWADHPDTLEADYNDDGTIACDNLHTVGIAPTSTASQAEVGIIQHVRYNPPGNTKCPDLDPSDVELDPERVYLWLESESVGLAPAQACALAGLLYKAAGAVANVRTPNPLQDVLEEVSSADAEAAASQRKRYKSPGAAILNELLDAVGESESVDVLALADRVLSYDTYADAWYMSVTMAQFWGAVELSTARLASAEARTDG